MFFPGEMDGVSTNTVCVIIVVALAVVVIASSFWVIVDETEQQLKQQSIAGSIKELKPIFLEAHHAARAENMTDVQASRLFDIIFAESRFIA